MIKTTIGDLLDGNLDDLDTSHHQLYQIQDGDTVLYVGQTTWGVLFRLWTHLVGGFGGGPSRLGRIVRANLPAARNWQLVFYTLDDCHAVTRVQAELDLIASTRPCLNVQNNPDPIALPVDCIDPDYEARMNPNLEVTPSDFVPL